MSKIQWHLEKRFVNELIPHSKNPRIFTEKGLKDLDKSIDKIGMAQPININTNGTILSGHARLLTLKNKGVQEVDVYVPSRELTEKEQEEVLIRMNANNAGEWDFDKLANEWETSEILDWGLDLPITDDIELNDNNSNIIQDEIPEEVKTRCKKGQIWKLGDHRMMCGDSTSISDVEKLMNGVKADMVFTDPPYGMKKEKDGVLNDNLNYEDLLEFNKKWIPLTFMNTKDNGSWYCWGIDEPLMDIYSHILKPMMKENKITFRNLITWDKGNGQGQLCKDFRMYPIADEKCLFVQCGINCLTLNADQYWEEYEPIRKYLYDERIKCGWDIPQMKTIAGHSDKSRDHWTSKSQFNLPTKDVYIKFQEWAKENKIDAFNKEYEQLREEYEQLRAYFDNTHDNMNNVWHFSRTNNKERELTGGHATPKPLELCARAIKSSSRENESILDVFGGSGSTLIACEQLNRKCFMMELDEHYCDVIIERWERLTGNKAELLSE